LHDNAADPNQDKQNCRDFATPSSRNSPPDLQKRKTLTMNALRRTAFRSATLTLVLAVMAMLAPIASANPVTGGVCKGAAQQTAINSDFSLVVFVIRLVWP